MGLAQSPPDFFPLTAGGSIADLAVAQPSSMLGKLYTDAQRRPPYPERRLPWQR